MWENISMKSKTSLIIKSFIFFIISVLLGFYFKTGLSEYNSILDKYLNFNYILLIYVFLVLNFLFAVCFLVLFIICVIKRKTEATKKSKIFSNILIVFLVIANIIATISVISFQANEDYVVDTIPDTVTAYVDFNTTFGTSHDDYFSEQTVFNKISTEIPTNYKVEQASSDSSVQTSCVEIIDNNLLHKYYNEQEKRYLKYNIIQFNADELKSLSADKGFYYVSDNYNLGIVVIKGDKLFDVYAFSENIKLTNELMLQIAAL